VKYSKFSN